MRCWSGELEARGIAAVVSFRDEAELSSVA